MVIGSGNTRQSKKLLVEKVFLKLSALFALDFRIGE
jgi:hypothetical protein